MKVLMICDFSVEEVRKKLKLLDKSWESHVRSFLGKSIEVVDHGLWNYYAIQEFNKREDIELYVISFHHLMKKRLQIINIGSSKCYFIQMNGSSIFSSIKNRIFGQLRQENKDLKFIGKLIKDINPDIVHVIGAESRFHSEAILQIPKTIPTIVQLQTLLIDPDVLSHYPELACRIPSERKVLERADFIGTRHKKYGELIKRSVKEDSIILNTQLAVAEPIDTTEVPKEFDFVYFSADINKACDLAIEAFSMSKIEHPEITLDIVGYYDTEYKEKIDKRIKELKLEGSVIFEGRQKTHDDVMRQIKKARYALVPLKTDMISSTVRESMAKGLPLVTTITEGTPKLNSKRECVLLSEVGDAEAMANNMNKLIEDPLYAKKLRDNALQSYSEEFSNSYIVARWIECYKLCVDYFKNGNQIPKEYLLDC